MGILGGGGPDWGPVGAAGGVNEADWDRDPGTQDRGQRGGWGGHIPQGHSVEVRTFVGFYFEKLGSC